MTDTRTRTNAELADYIDALNAGTIARDPDILRATDARLRSDAARISAMDEALADCERLFNEALPKFNWGASALDANAITLLNQVPLNVRAARTARGES